jgi:hypothetical protein
VSGARRHRETIRNNFYFLLGFGKFPTDAKKKGGGTNSDTLSCVVVCR